MQAEYSDNRDCEYRKAGLHGLMDLEEIRQRMNARGYRNADMARRLGLAPNKITKIFSQERRLTVQEMDSIRSWLQDEPQLASLPVIPIIGQVAAGNWREAVQNPTGWMPSPDAGLSPNAYALDVTGDSMNLLVDEGGKVVVEPDDKALFPEKYYVVINGEGETTFKQFKADPARLVPCSTNPAHKEILIGSGEPFEVVGRVSWRAARM